MVICCLFLIFSVQIVVYWCNGPVHLLTMVTGIASLIIAGLATILKHLLSLEHKSSSSVLFPLIY